jgi:O-antigen chain-terminating methyltransferase
MRVEAKAAIESMSVRVNDTFAPVNSRIQDLRRNVSDQERRLGLLLEEARKRFPKPISRAQIGAMLTEEDHQLDAMYASFEDEFRGTRTDIRQRQSIYLPYIREVNAGTSAAPVVDLGCGRGEWLELLGSEGLSAKGVDRNRIFLAGCRELNLDVHEQDALTFLRQCKPNSMGAVTSFHMIEHVPHRILISLIDETLRVLRPGGVVIFETPNPKNLIVSSCNFYLDPTHLHPLPPELSRYLLEARGFCHVNILEMHPFEAHLQITEGAGTIKDTLNKYLFSAQDYAVIGRKAA